MLLLRGITKGESTARLARELHLSRQTIHTVRQRLQTNLNDNAPTGVIDGQTFEVNEVYQNTGEKSTPHPDVDDSSRRRATKQPGHGTDDNDRPPIIHIISRESGEERCWVVDHSDKATCQGILAEAVPSAGTTAYSDEYRSYHGIEMQHATVNHGQHE